MYNTVKYQFIISELPIYVTSVEELTESERDN